MSIERRLRRLESAQAGDGRVIVIRKLVNEPDLGAMRRYFGDPAPPRNALIVLLQTFCCQDAAEPGQAPDYDLREARDHA